LRVESRLGVSVSDSLKFVGLVALPDWVLEVRLGVVEHVHHGGEVVSELPGTIGLVAALEVSQRTCDYSVDGAQDDRGVASTARVEGADGGQGRGDDDLDE
jgi:hypothetical protein